MYVIGKVTEAGAGDQRIWKVIEAVVEVCESKSRKVEKGGVAGAGFSANVTDVLQKNIAHT